MAVELSGSVGRIGEKMNGIRAIHAAVRGASPLAAIALLLALIMTPAARGQGCAAWLAGASAFGSGVSGTTSPAVNALAVLPDGDVIVGGSFTTAGNVAASRVARYNPMTGGWSALGSGVNAVGGASVNALALLPGGDLIVGGQFTTAGGVAASNIARYSPSTNTWSALGSGVGGDSSPGVVALAALIVLPGGDVIVGGQFTTAGGVAARNIARYNPTTNTWSALGSGTNGNVFALAVLPSGDVIVGGSFLSAGGVLANRIARYNPSTNTWSALGAGTDGTVFALAVLPDGDVIVGGDFFSAGSVLSNDIARYNPSTGVWSATGTGTNGTAVYALAVLPGGDVIVGGVFSTAGGVTASRIARYFRTTNNWSALGSGTDSIVNALAVLPGGDVIVGGAFRSAGVVAADRIARCNPETNTWSALGLGVSGVQSAVVVNALAVLPGGDLIVAGVFSDAGEVSVNNIARYNSITGVWSALGAGTNANSAVNALAVLSGGDVIVGGNFTTAGGVAANGIARYSPTTNTWSALGSGMSANSAVNALAVLPGGDVIVGGSFTTAGSVTALNIARYNPTTNMWSAIGSAVGGSLGVRALAVRPGGDVIVGGDFNTAGGVAASNIARYNPSTNTWSPLGAGTNAGVRALAVLPGGDVVVGGNFNTAGGVSGRNNIALYSPATNIWSPLGSGTNPNSTVSALAVLPSGDLIAAGNFTTAGGVSANNIARYSPATNTWSALGFGTNSTVSALAVLPGGSVIVGGQFGIAGGVTASRIARYNPTSNVWLALRAGLNGDVFALAVLPGGGSGDVIAGGFFSSAGGVTAGGVGRYNPVTRSWSALGSGTNGDVYALAVLPPASGGDIIAGGFFSTAGGVAASGIARFNPSTNTWSALGSGTNGTVWAMAVLPGGDVIVGGGFTTAGGVTANSIARYNPTTNTWSALGSGTNGNVFALAVLPGGDVVVGGIFTAAGGVAASNIARYSPSTNTWSALGSGTNGTVYALAALPDGNVIAGGGFSFAGGVAANRIARFNPNAGVWSPLATGTDGDVYALAVRPGEGGAGEDVIVGGSFTTAGDINANRIARYNASTNTWSALGSGLNGDVSALAVLPDGDVFVGGGFTTAGGNVSAYYARYTFGVPAPSITTHPAPVSSCLSGTASFAVVASGTGPLTYQWQWQPAGPGTAWAALVNGVNLNSQGQPAFDVSGVGTATASIRSLSGATGSVGDFRCIVSNACASVTSEPATLTIIVCACSPADITNTDGTLPGVPDGVIDNGDFQAFFAAFFLPESDPLRLAADIANTDGETVLTGGGPDGAIDNGDFNAFFAAFFGGCP